MFWTVHNLPTAHEFLSSFERLVRCSCYYLIRDGGLDLRVWSFVEDHAREQVINEWHEERLVFVDKFWQVHVS